MRIDRNYYQGIVVVIGIDLLGGTITSKLDIIGTMIKRFLLLTFFGLFSALVAQADEVAMGDTVYVKPNTFVSLDLTYLVQAHEYAGSNNPEAVRAMVKSGDLIMIEKPAPAQLREVEVIEGWGKVALVSMRARGIDGLLWVPWSALAKRP